jgi:hypothetical protein
VKAWAGPAREASRVFVDCTGGCGCVCIVVTLVSHGLTHTVGHGGHSLELLAAHPAAAVVGIDVDAQVMVSSGFLLLYVSPVTCRVWDAGAGTS